MIMLVRPKNSLSFHNLGDLYGFYLKDSSKSELNYLQSIRNDPMNVDAYLNLTDLYWYSGGEEGKKAIPEFLLHAIKNNANSESKLPLVGRLAKYYEDIKDFPNAIKYYQQILDADPGNSAIHEEIERLRRM